MCILSIRQSDHNRLLAILITVHDFSHMSSEVSSSLIKQIDHNRLLTKYLNYCSKVFTQCHPEYKVQLQYIATWFNFTVFSYLIVQNSGGIKCDKSIISRFLRGEHWQIYNSLVLTF